MANTNSTQLARPLAGVIGFFEEPSTLLAATAKVRDAKYQDFDVFTPYPIHGMDHAMGLKRSPLPYVTFVAGAMGCLLAFLFQYWTSAVDWPLNVGGKPLNSWPAFVPVMFELTVLFAALSTVGAMFAMNGLPNMKRKVFDPGITRDRFALVIEAGVDEVKPGFKKFDEAEAKSLLTKLGAKEVRTVYTEGWF